MTSILPSTISAKHQAAIHRAAARAADAYLHFCMTALREASESPIEELMGAIIAVASICHPVGWSFHPKGRTFEDDFKPDKLFIGMHVFPQATIKPYRVDFLMVLKRKNGSFERAVLECDGHDFHDRTKEQAARDKSRDRDLQTRGYRVLRFTGSEIHADIEARAIDLLKFMRSLGF